MSENKCDINNVNNVNKKMSIIIKCMYSYKIGNYLRVKNAHTRV